jgi:Fur family ferric uptake transcriptional regulator
MSCKTEFLEALRSRGFRFTPQREMILEVLHHMPEHVTAEQIYARVHELSSQVDIATVYRTLELLEELQFVSVIEVGGQERCFEFVGRDKPHAHLVCQSCGRILDMDTETYQALTLRLKDEHGFEAGESRLAIVGHCAACQGRQTVMAESAAC